VDGAGPARAPAALVGTRHGVGRRAVGRPVGIGVFGRPGHAPAVATGLPVPAFGRRLACVGTGPGLEAATTEDEEDNEVDAHHQPPTTSEMPAPPSTKVGVTATAGRSARACLTTKTAPTAAAAIPVTRVMLPHRVLRWPRSSRERRASRSPTDEVGESSTASGSPAAETRRPTPTAASAAPPPVKAQVQGATRPRSALAPADRSSPGRERTVADGAG